MALSGGFVKIGEVTEYLPVCPLCYWKQWRWPRTKIKNLLALGVSLKTAIQHGVSSKSYWHMARTPAMQQALNNDWLKAQGLPSIKTLWCKAQGNSS